MLFLPPEETEQIMNFSTRRRIKEWAAEAPCTTHAAWSPVLTFPMLSIKPPAVSGL